jgi:hypothetical protein
MINLNNTLLVVRERTFAELCDLSLHIIRQLFKPLLVVALWGMIPCALFNYWWLWKLPLESIGDTKQYLFLLVLLGWWQWPLATAPMTLILGQAMFQRKVDYRRAWADYWGMATQLFLHMLLRTVLMCHGLFLAYPAVRNELWGLFFLLTLMWLIPALRWTYVTEILMLERNPLNPQPGQLSTSQRSRALHGGDAGLIFSRMLGMIMVELLIGAITFYSLWFLWGNLQGEIVINWFSITVLFPIAFWLTQAFLAVVRFLCYLDIRIRREGWEVDLALRAEAEHLQRALQLTAANSPNSIAIEQKTTLSAPTL